VSLLLFFDAVNEYSHLCKESSSSTGLTAMQCLIQEEPLNSFTNWQRSVRSRIELKVASDDCNCFTFCLVIEKYLNNFGMKSLAVVADES